jgi:uncharacterized protein
MEIEKRSIMQAPEVRKADGGMTLRGYAAVFNSETDIGGYFRETIAPGAFADSVDGDVRALVDHDSGRVIGRTKAGTLRMVEDERGLAVEIDLPDTSDGRDLAALVERGDIDGMSFGFAVRKEEWDETVVPPKRTIRAVELFEVSAVTWPAYADTTLAMRSLGKSEKPVTPVAGYFLRKAMQAHKERGL